MMKSKPFLAKSEDGFTVSLGLEQGRIISEIKKHMKNMDGSLKRQSKVITSIRESHMIWKFGF